MASTSYTSETNYNLPQTPVGITDPIVNEAISDLHDVIAQLVAEIESLKDRVTALGG